MDYKYIEQLLDRYWACETSLEEERILRAFFSQDELPAHLAKYKALFGYEQQQKEIRLGEDFDQRVLKMVGETQEPKKEVVIKARRLTLSYRLRPLYRAAASVAIVLLLGTAAQHTFHRQSEPTGWDYNVANYHDTYNAPQEALEVGMGGIEEIKDMLCTVPSKGDSIAEAIDSNKAK